MFKAIFISFVLILLIFGVTPANAAVNPESGANNRFGIHIIDENDLEKASELVNSNGGEWGYVTIVIREDERDIKRWQTTFERMRRLKLIPIVRLATSSQSGVWVKPQEEDIDNWVDFLSSLNWVVKNRYVVLFNEPNHAKEWGGVISPHEYAKIAKAFRDRLKSSSEDFFVLPAGFDQAAGNTSQSMDTLIYWEKMHDSIPDIFKIFDGWSSHSYPNPDFSGNPRDTGRGSVLGFQWELNELSKYGLSKTIPVFITETGWSGLDSEKVAQNYKFVFNSVWNSSQIIAVTPFVLNYETPPFSGFSWYTKDGLATPQYEEVKKLSKIKGTPAQDNLYEFTTSPFPDELIEASEYQLELELKNTGQIIWNEGDIEILIGGSFPKDFIRVESVGSLSPGEEKIVTLEVKTPSLNQILLATLEVTYKGKTIGEKYSKQVSIVPPTSLLIGTSLGFKLSTQGNDFTVLLYEGVRFIKSIEHVVVEKGIGVIKDLHDVVPKKTYRFVILKPYYIPRQAYAYMSEKETEVDFGRLYPLDLDKDGKFSRGDIFEVIRNPLLVINLWSPF